MDRELIQAFKRSARSDLELAAELFEKGKYNYASVFYSQQSAEKISKSYLACRGITGVRKHNISGILARFIDKRDIIKDLQFLESHVTKSRYPFRIERRLVSPPDAYTREETELALTKARNIFNYLIEKINRKIGE